MKLVMHFIASDDCTYSFDVNLPLEYDSAEKALVDFETAMQEAVANRQTKFMFTCHPFYVSDFKGDCLPTFYTLEEWFEEFRFDRM